MIDCKSLKRYAAVLLATLALLPIPLAGAQPVRAVDPTIIPTGPAPLEELEPVEFSFMAVDVTIHPVDAGITLEVRNRTRLRNPNKKEAFERQVGYTAPAVSGVRIGTQNGGLTPTQEPGPWKLTLPPDGDAVIEGTQVVGANGVLADLRFNWSALSVWGAPLAAVRLTLHFPADLESDQLLMVSPEPTERNTVTLTWSYEKRNPTDEVRVLYITPHYWRSVSAARRAVSSGQATVSDYLALAAALEPLVNAEGMPEAVAHAFQAEALAALRQAVTAGPEDATAHAALAGYLSSQAQGDPAMLAEAVAEYRKATSLAPDDSRLKSQLLATLEALIAACRQADDRRGLLAALDVAEELGAFSSPERAAGYADLAVGLFEANRPDEGMATISTGFGQEVLSRYDHLRAHFYLVVGEVETHGSSQGVSVAASLQQSKGDSGRRLLRFTLEALPGQEEAAEQEIVALLDALQSAGGQVQREGTDGHAQIEVLLPFTDAASLQATSQTLRASLPADADPALALIAAAIGAPQLRYEQTSGLAADHLVYEERVDLQAAQASLEKRLAQLEAARTEAQAPTSDPVEAAQRRACLALLDYYESEWRALASGSRVRYRLLPAEDVIAPQWLVAWGEARTLQWSTALPAYQRFMPYAVGALILLIGLMVGLAVYRWQRRRLAHRSRKLSETRGNS